MGGGNSSPVFIMKEKKEKDKRKLLREAESYKKKVQQRRDNRIPPPQGKNEQFLSDFEKKILKDAKEQQELKRKEGNDNIKNWAKDEAKFVASHMRHAVSSIGGFGEGNKAKCEYCDRIGGYMRGEYDEKEKKVIYQCEECYKKNLKPKKSYLKIVIH